MFCHAIQSISLSLQCNSTAIGSREISSSQSLLSGLDGRELNFWVQHTMQVFLPLVPALEP